MASATIKVDRLTLISSLETALAEKKSTLAAAVKAYPAACDAYAKQIAAIKKLAAKDAVTNGRVSVSKTGYSIHGTLPEGTEFPTEPADPSVPVYKHNVRRGGQYTGLVVEIEAIEKALKVLRLSTEATVPASYYQSIIDFI